MLLVCNPYFYGRVIGNNATLGKLCITLKFSVCNISDSDHSFLILLSTPHNSPSIIGSWNLFFEVPMNRSWIIRKTRWGWAVPSSGQARLANQLTYPTILTLLPPKIGSSTIKRKFKHSGWDYVISIKQNHYLPTTKNLISCSQKSWSLINFQKY